MSSVHIILLLFLLGRLELEQSDKMDCMCVKDIEWNIESWLSHAYGQNSDLKISSIFVCAHMLCVHCFCFFYREYAFVPASKFSTQSTNEPNVKLNEEFRNPVMSRSVTDVLSLQVVGILFLIFAM